MVKVEQMAPVSSTVLIEGESGTGKELVARALASLGPTEEQALHRRERWSAARDAARERAVRA
jgi:DNA-binding NtrC family response regulator